MRRRARVVCVCVHTRKSATKAQQDGHTQIAGGGLMCGGAWPRPWRERVQCHACGMFCLTELTLERHSCTHFNHPSGRPNTNPRRPAPCPHGLPIRHTAHASNVPSVFYHDQPCLRFLLDTSGLNLLKHFLSLFVRTLLWGRWRHESRPRRAAVAARAGPASVHTGTVRMPSLSLSFSL